MVIQRSIEIGTAKIHLASGMPSNVRNFQPNLLVYDEALAALCMSGFLISDCPRWEGLCAFLGWISFLADLWVFFLVALVRFGDGGGRRWRKKSVSRDWLQSSIIVRSPRAYDCLRTETSVISPERSSKEKRHYRTEHTYSRTHTHANMYMYIYIWMCEWVYVCLRPQTSSPEFLFR